MTIPAKIIAAIAKAFAAVVIAAHMVLGLFVPSLGYHPASVASSTPAAIPATSPAQATLPVAPTATGTKAAAKPAAAKSIAKAPAPAQTPAASGSTATTPVSNASTVDLTQLNVNVRAALVNILCTTKSGGAFEPISGSGVIIDSRGIILTNAHVGQFFLLRDYGTPDNVDCIVRTGSPAMAMYHAELLYLPPAWVAANAQQLIAAQATGTGENDFAFLRITGTTDPSATLPSTFPHLIMSTASVDLGDQMFLASYPAGFLSGELIQTNLFASSAFAYVVQLFTFSESTVDLFSVAGSITSQPGSSGGAAVRTSDGTLAGIISTATDAAETSERDLRAISVGYIDRALVAAGKGGITGLLSQDAATTAANFNATVAPGERAQLYAALDGAH